MGSEVVYLAGRAVRSATMTPFDVCALRLGDATVLAGTAPDDAEAYVSALRVPGVRAVASTADGVVSADGVRALVERLCGSSWQEAEDQARGAGALVGAYPSEQPG